jgi:Fanconi anemia group M protein
VVDAREQGSAVPAALERFGDLALTYEQLPTADYLLSESVAVERKEASDFVLSIMDRRLFEQAAKLLAEFDRPVVIIEGDLRRVRSAMAPEAFRGAISYLTVVLGITVLQTADAAETAAMLRVMARHAQEGLGYEVALRGAKPKATHVYAQYLVEGLPGVGAGRAQALLRHFGSPARVLTATADELAQVPGVGRKSAERIVEALATPYVPPAAAG